MFRLNDLILCIVIFSSMSAGILRPEWTAFFQPFPLYLMMFLLFLSFLPIELGLVWHTVRHQGPTVLWLTFCKLIAIPVLVYYFFDWCCPSFAVAALLLSGISTGVVAPFISSLVNANSPLVLVMVVASSPLVPFTLPALVRLLEGQSIAISFWHMTRMLSLVVFVPIVAVELLRRTAPSAVQALMRRRFPISLAVFAIINMGVFSKYSRFFNQNPETILEALWVGIALAGLFVILGIASQWRSSVENQLAAAVSLGNMNNVLVIVFAAQFFGPLEPTLSAVYMIPFFGLILPLRVYRRLRIPDDG